MTITKDEYQILVSFLKANSGIEIDEGKDYLFKSRLLPLTQLLGLTSISELVSDLRHGSTCKFGKNVIEAMTTHESLFFRDGSPFENLKNIMISELVTKGQRKNIRIWSAACSTGQEPYSIAMTLAELPGCDSNWSFSIVATDISSQIVKKAQEGLFTDFEVQRGCTPAVLSKYFTKTNGGWRVNDLVRKNIVFKEANLLQPFNSEQPFDIIFCRNVLIYFNLQTKGIVLNHLWRCLNSDGFLVLGGTDTIFGVSEDFDHIFGDPPGLYRKKIATKIAQA